MIRTVVDDGKILLSLLRWNNTASYDTITMLADAMRSDGQMKPVQVNAYGEVLPGGGAKRCAAARRLGWAKIKVEVVL